MAYLLRSIAIVGVIALNSPVHDSKPDVNEIAVDARTAIAILSRIDPKAAVNGSTSLREAAEVLAGLEPETQARVLAIAASAVKPAEQVARQR
jgi:hypothetical protein